MSLPSNKGSSITNFVLRQMEKGTPKDDLAHKSHVRGRPQTMLTRVGRYVILEISTVRIFSLITLKKFLKKSQVKLVKKRNSK